MKEFSRSERVAEALQRELASIIQMEMRDPRVALVNINAVEVSRDLSHAKIYVTFVDHPDDNVIAERIRILNQASGFLRAKVGKSITLRVIPTLHFQFDVSVVRGQHLTSLIDKAIKQDALHHPGSDQKNDSGQK